MPYWKLLTHDYRPPLQGGDPLFSGKFPTTLPTVPLDRSQSECGIQGGWHFVRSIEAGFKIVGMWPNGHPIIPMLVEPVGEVIERGDKLRAASLVLTRHATEEEIRAAIERFSLETLQPYASEMAEEQWQWWKALARPLRDGVAVETGLRTALEARRLPWKLTRFRAARAARDARDAWAARAARDARAAWDAWDARAARAAWAAWDARDAWAARDAWDAWAAWAAWDAWAARAALSNYFAARNSWIELPAEKYTVGIRDACRHGLSVAIPTGPEQLGWAMESV